MKITLSTNRSAGFSRAKMFACILGVLVLGDLLFRSGKGLNTVFSWKDSVAPVTAAPKPTIPPLNYKPKDLTPPPTPAPVVESKPLPKPPVKKPAPRFGPGGDAGPLLRATADQKDLRPVAINKPPRITNQAPESVPLPIALPK